MKRAGKPFRAAWLLGCGALMAALISSCATDTTRPAAYSVSGPVRLIGFRTATNGAFLGTEIVDDADGVVVELIYGSRVVATTSTVDGVYWFTGIRPGAYTARTRLFASFGDATDELTVATFNVTATDTLTLASVGDLYPAPNPSAKTDTVGVYFVVPVSQPVDLRIRALSGATVRTLIASPVAAGAQAAQWSGLDEAGHPAAGDHFWVTYEAADGIRCQLLFR